MVKHGTTSNCLGGILTDGLLMDEAVGGVPVASCYVAYALSLEVFLEESKAFFESRDGGADASASAELERFQDKEAAAAPLTLRELEAVHQFACSALTLPTDETIVPGVPVVLNVTLQQDCVIRADCNCVPADTNAAAAAGRVWSEHGSAVIPRTLPPDWVTSVEHVELAQRAPLFPLCCALLDAYPTRELLQRALDDDGACLLEGLSRYLAPYDEDAAFAPGALRLRSDLFRMACAAKTWRAKEADSRSYWHRLMADVTRINGNQQHLKFSGVCGPIPPDVAPLLARDRERMGFVQHFREELAIRPREMGLALEL